MVSITICGRNKRKIKARSWDLYSGWMFQILPVAEDVKPSRLDLAKGGESFAGSIWWRSRGLIAFAGSAILLSLMTPRQKCSKSISNPLSPIESLISYEAIKRGDCNDEISVARQFRSYPRCVKQ